MLVLTFAGIVLSVILRDSIPDSTLLWFAVFAISLIIMTISEIRSYLHLHKTLHQKKAMEQEAMSELFKSRLTGKDKKPLTPADNAKLVDQMATELKARIGSSKTLTAENVKQMTKGLTSQLPHIS
jgi:aspartokinase-like uncharacterized kinase